MTTDEFWLADEPVKYKIRKTEGSDLREAGVHIVRYEDSDDNAEQALMEIIYDGDTLRLTQIDGDLDAKTVIIADQDHMRRYANHRLNIWRRIWKVALAA